MTSENTRRPPYWSVQMPRKTLVSEPVRMGVPTSRPNCVSVSPSSCLIRTPMMEKMVHTAKHVVNATVLIVRAFREPGYACPVCI